MAEGGGDGASGECGRLQGGELGGALCWKLIGDMQDFLVGDKDNSLGAELLVDAARSGPLML